MKQRTILQYGSLVVIALFTAAIFYVVFSVSQRNATLASSIEVELQNIQSTIAISGNVTSQQEVELAFERSGRVDAVTVAVGDTVNIAQALVKLESEDLRAKAREIEAKLATEQAILDDIGNGANISDIKVQQTKLENANNELLRAKTDLDVAQEQADAEMAAAEFAAMRNSLESAIVGKNALLTLSDIQNSYFNSGNQESTSISSAKTTAVFQLLGQNNAGDWDREFISVLDAGVFGRVQDLSSSQDLSQVDSVISDLVIALDAVRFALQIVPVKAEMTSADVSLLATEKSAIADELSDISSKQQAILTQKAVSLSSISTAQRGVTTAENKVALEESNLEALNAGATIEELKAQRGRVNALREQLLQNALEQDKLIVRSPIEGVVTSVSIDVGEIAQPQVAVITVNSVVQEIEANVSELDIGSISEDQAAEVSFDAFGEHLRFPAIIQLIEPVETLLNNVPTYTVTLELAEPDDRIRPGMSANIDVVIEERQGSAVVPRNAVYFEGDSSYVSKVLEDGVIEKIQVELGAVRDGKVEVVQGLNEGDRVIVQ